MIDLIEKGKSGRKGNAENMKITGLKTNHIANPLGYDIKSPVLSFVVEESTGKKLSAARIRISKNADLSDTVMRMLLTER